MYRGSILLKEMFFPASGTTSLQLTPVSGTSSPQTQPVTSTGTTAPRTATTTPRTATLTTAPISIPTTPISSQPRITPTLSQGSLAPTSTAVVGIMGPTVPIKNIEASSPSIPSDQIPTPIAVSGGGGGGGSFTEETSSDNGTSAGGGGAMVQKASPTGNDTRKKIITWIIVISVVVATYALLSKLSKNPQDGKNKQPAA